MGFSEACMSLCASGTNEMGGGVPTRVWEGKSELGVRGTDMIGTSISSSLDETTSK